MTNGEVLLISSVSLTLSNMISLNGVKTSHRMRPRMRYTTLVTLSRVGKKDKIVSPSIRTEVVNAHTKQIMAKALLKSTKSVSTYLKIGWVRIREELRYSGEITKVVISKYNDKWYASITVRRLDSSNYQHQPALFDDKAPIGIDVGINTLATCSNGDTYDNPRPLKRYERKLARANRRLSRRQKGSQNWFKAKFMLTAVHARIANIREDAHHQATLRIVRKASAIGIETLKVTNMLKNRKIAKALSDSALGGFLTKLKYKANRRGIPITEAPQFFASSKTCSNCGYKKADLTLSDRTYQCSECGFECDRDLNAAINLCPET